MHADANDLLLFARVMEAGSFSAAAERLDLPKSTVSRRIAALESRLGERLITRSTRRLAITDFGESILEHARRMLEESEAAAALAQHRQATPTGRLRVSVPPDFAERLIVTDFFMRFAEAYPEVRLQLDMSARRVDLLVEGFDLAIRIAPRLPDDATLVARRLCDLPRALYASPLYLDRKGRPKEPEDLYGHTGLRLLSSAGEAGRWRLHKGGEEWEGLPEGPITTNSVTLIHQLACQGLGIGFFTERLIRNSVQQGELERVLPEWSAEPITVWAVMPGRRLVPSRTRVFVEALTHMLLTCSEFDGSGLVMPGAALLASHSTDG